MIFKWIASIFLTGFCIVATVPWWTEGHTWGQTTVVTVSIVLSLAFMLIAIWNDRGGTSTGDDYMAGGFGS